LTLGSWGNAPTGREVETFDQRLGDQQIYGLTPANAHRVKIARQAFFEANADDFDQDGKDWIDPATGKRYRLVRFDPTPQRRPAGYRGGSVLRLGWLARVPEAGRRGGSQPDGRDGLGRGDKSMRPRPYNVVSLGDDYWRWLRSSGDRVTAPRSPKRDWMRSCFSRSV
jgi:hypothetical protein